MVSGHKVPDKFARSGFTAVKSSRVNAPIIEEFPLVMECELADVLKKGILFLAAVFIIGKTTKRRKRNEKEADF